MKPLFTHLFWDFDGTLYDTYGQITSAMLLALEELHQSASSTEVYALLKQSVYHASLTLAERFSLPVQRVLDAFHRYHQTAGDFPLFEGTEDCLRSLKALGCHHYLYTHRDSGAVKQLEKNGLLALFSGCVTSDNGFPHKPAPNALEAMVSQYGIAKSQAAMIGDRDLDILAGHNAGMAGILLDPKGFFQDLDVEYRVNSMKEIKALIGGDELSA